MRSAPNKYKVGVNVIKKSLSISLPLSFAISLFLFDLAKLLCAAIKNDTGRLASKETDQGDRVCVRPINSLLLALRHIPKLLHVRGLQKQMCMYAKDLIL